MDGKVVADMAVVAGFKVLGFMDDRAPDAPLPGYDIIGTVGDLRNIISQWPNVRTVLAIGDNSVRKRLALELKEAIYATVIHPSAVVSFLCRGGPRDGYHA